MHTRLIFRALGVTAAVVAAAVCWLLLGPAQLGGPVTYAVVSGTSMEPSLHRGDLAIVRAEPRYAVGDVVLYSSRSLDREVLHRIVGRDGDTYVLKGDNNSFRDPERVQPSQLRGQLWAGVPGVGRVIDWAHQPLNAAIALFVLVFVALGGGAGVSRRRRAGAPAADRRPLLVEQAGSPASTPAARPVLVAGLVAAAAFGLLAAVAWSSSPSVRQQIAGTYVHTGQFSYGAITRPSVVYPDGQVEPGQAVFTKLVPAVDVSFDYVFESSRRFQVQGGIALDAVVSDGSGWARTLPLASERPFEGPAAQVVGTLDLRRIEALTARMRALTGSGATTFAVAVTPRVLVAGYAGDSVVDRAYAPSLLFQLDTVSLRLDPSGGDPATALSVREPAEGVARVARRVGVGPLSLPVAEARVLGMLGLGMGLLAALVAGIALGRRPRGADDEPGRIAARHGDQIVDAVTTVPEGRWVTDVADIDSLVRLADHYDRVVLHGFDGVSHTYLVDDGIAVYRLTLGRERPAPAGAMALPEQG